MIFLGSVLARYGRFEDAIAVQKHLLDTVNLDPSTQHALRLGRAMAMLREDHLVDADRAINELRRDVSRASASANSANEDGGATDGDVPVSAGLALIEMYRDVKTGHPDEAIEMFRRTLPALRRQLGHRVADAYALAAKAHDFLGNEQQAREHWEKATLLSPPSELLRRYPELTSLPAKYQPALAPPEAA
jgi:tetratricopeptide (TPR) repeat protein